MLGEKGPIMLILWGMRDLSTEGRPRVEQFTNRVRDELAAVIEEEHVELEQAVMNTKSAVQTINATLPGALVAQGQPHVT